MGYLGDFDAHGTGGAGNCIDSGVEFFGVKIGHFFLGDFFDLICRNSSGDFGTWFVRSFLESQSLFDQSRNRREFGDKTEGTIFVDGYYGGDNITFHVFGSVVVLLDEVHDGKTVLAQGWAHWRGGSSGSGGKIEFQSGFDLFWCHDCIISAKKFF